MNFHLTTPLRRKKNVFVGLILAAAVILLSACFSSPLGLGRSTLTPEPGPPKPISTQKSPTQTSQPRASATPVLPVELQVNPADLRGVKVVLWEPFVGEMGELFKKFAIEFNRENEWGIQAEVKMLGSDRSLADPLNQPANEALPQVVLAPSAQLNAWLQAGRLAALGPYLAYPQTQMEKAVKEGFSPVFWQQDNIGGKQAGIPSLRSAYGLLYNKTWAAELGFSTPPLTPAQFRDQACEAAKVNNRSDYLEQRGTGGWLVDTSPEVTLSWLQAFGVDAIPTDESKDYHFKQDASVSALSFLRKMQEDGCLWVGKDPSPYQYFAERYALMISGSLQDLIPQAKMMAGQENQDEWLLIGYPASNGDPFVNAEGYSYGLVSGDAKQQIAGWLFMRWLSTPVNQARLGAIYPSLPVSSNIQDQPAINRSNFPWTLILPLEKSRVLPVPSLPSWLVARRPLEDAGWQLYNLASADQLPDILPQLDALIKELLIQ